MNSSFITFLFIIYINNYIKISTFKIIVNNKHIIQ